MDNELLIALVASLLQNTKYSEAMILEALVDSDGDVAEAARKIQDVQCPSSRKRKVMDVQEWVHGGHVMKAKKRVTATEFGSKQAMSPSVIQSSNAEASSSKMHSNIILPRNPYSSVKKPTQLLPLLLSNAKMVKENVPCTLHHSILPPELASKLFYIMSDLSNRWKRNKWWLFDRVVESPHLTSFFARRTNGLDNNEDWQEAAQFWYNGRATDPPEIFPSEMELACRIVEKIVNEEINKRRRYSLEWGGSGGIVDSLWKANVAASNCYQGGKESVGFHSDQLTYLGPCPTIASLSLGGSLALDKMDPGTYTYLLHDLIGTQRNFTLREVVPNDQVKERKAQTFNIPLPHNSLIIMHAPCQERYKHAVLPQPAVDLYRPLLPREPGIAVEPSNKRINITFRFYRPDFQPTSIPRCHCDVPTILRPDMKNRDGGECKRYWWTCYAGAQNDGKGCKFWKVMDMKAEGRGPCIQ